MRSTKEASGHQGEQASMGVPAGLQPHRIEGGLRVRGLFKKKSTPGHPLVSVVTVVRNGQRHLENTILSVLDQLYDNIEFIVVDGASQDRTLDIIREYDARIAYWVSEPDSGVYEALNKGLAAMTGEYWAYLSADDMYAPTTVAAAVAALEQNPQYGIVYGDMQMVSEEGKCIAVYRYPGFDERRYRLNVNPCQHGHASTFVRASVYRAIGGFNPSYKYAGDYEYFLRAVNHRIELLHEPKIVALMRMHQGQISQKYRREQWKEHLSIYQAYFGRPRLNAWSVVDNLRRYARNLRYYLKRALAYR